jgi:hypothetical protein
MCTATVFSNIDFLFFASKRHEVVLDKFALGNFLVVPKPARVMHMLDDISHTLAI